MRSFFFDILCILLSLFTDTVNVFVFYLGCLSLDLTGCRGYVAAVRGARSPGPADRLGTHMRAYTRRGLTCSARRGLLGLLGLVGLLGLLGLLDPCRFRHLFLWNSLTYIARKITATLIRSVIKPPFSYCSLLQVPPLIHP